jgi:hypothetical protein
MARLAAFIAPRGLLLSREAGRLHGWMRLFEHVFPLDRDHVEDRRSRTGGRDLGHELDLVVLTGMLRENELADRGDAGEIEALGRMMSQTDPLARGVRNPNEARHDE